MTATPTLPPVRRAIDILTDNVALAGRRVVDVGCGEGAMVRALTALGALVTGVECGAEMLTHARAAKPAGNETYVEGVGQALPLGDDSADCVTFFNSLHHVPTEHMTAALREAARVAGASGLVLVNEPLAEGNFFAITRLVEDETEVRAAAYAAIRQAVGDGLLVEQAEIIYRNPVRWDSFDAFAERMSRIDAERRALVAARNRELRDLFEAAADTDKGGFYFEQPARLNILVKVA